MKNFVTLRCANCIEHCPRQCFALTRLNPVEDSAQPDSALSWTMICLDSTQPCPGQWSVLTELSVVQNRAQLGSALEVHLASMYISDFWYSSIISGNINNLLHSCHKCLVGAVFFVSLDHLLTHLQFKRLRADRDCLCHGCKFTKSIWCLLYRWKLLIHLH